MFEGQEETCIDWTGFTGNIQFKDFFSNLLLKIIIYCVTDQQSATSSRRSTLNFNSYLT